MSIIPLTSACLSAAAVAQPCGQPWTTASAGPPARSQHAMAYDSGRDVVVMFGGRDTGVPRGDTWEWDANGAGGIGAWTLRSSTGPTARYGHALAYDPVRARTVLFGGRAGLTTFNDTWEWSGTAWVQVPAAGPPARGAPVMAFDQVRSRVVMHGGLRDEPCCLSYSDTWEWDGTTWTLRAAAGPPAPPAVGMVLDAASGHAVMLAYRQSSHAYELWQWDGSTWTALPGTPPQSRDGTLVYDGRVTFIGFTGVPLVGALEAWSWDGAVWSGRDTSGPTLRRLMAAAFDGHRAMLFGGLPLGGSPFNGPALAEGWLHDPATRAGPLMTQQATGMTVDPGQPIQLSVSATGTAPLTYQWRRDTQPVANGGVVSGATSPQLSISAASIVHQGRYDVAVTDACGTTTVGPVWVGVTCYVNCDASSTPPILNVQDFSCFLSHVATGDSYANCDHSTTPPVLNVLDFNCFINAFARGCS